MLIPDCLNIFRVAPRNFTRNEWKEKMAFKAFILLGLVLCFVSYQIGFSILMKTALIYGSEGYDFFWSRVIDSALGHELASKSLSPAGYQPFFTYMNISIIEILVPCVLKSYYVTKRLKQLVGQRMVYAVYFAMVAAYASFAREWRMTRDAVLLILNGLFVLRTFDLDRERPFETVATIALTCAYVVPLHLALDLVLVMCLSEEVVRAYQGDTKRLKVFAGCVTIDCVLVQLDKLIEVGDFVSETLHIVIGVTVSLILLNVALTCGRPKEFRSSLPAFVVLFYIYTRSSRLS